MLDYLSTSLHFKLLNKISDEGKNSIVSLAHDIQLDAEIVVKQIKKTDFKDPIMYFDEAKKLYSSNHPNIVPVQYSCQDDANIYITMPLFQKGSLNQLIEIRCLKPKEIIKYSIDFLSGLHHIHTKNLIHLDIKPTNILISNSDDAILTDFGLAKYLNDEGYTTFERFYNLHQAPEMILDNVATHQTDIYQAGLTLYRMCAGNLAFKSQLSQFINTDGKLDKDKYKAAITKSKFPDRQALPPHIPQKLKNYIFKALAVDPANRYNSVLSFLNDLASIEVIYNWQHTPDPTFKKWECVSEEKNYLVALNKIDDIFWSLKTTKSKLSGANERQIIDYCSKKATFDDVHVILKKALQNNSL
jgi:serine/threonine protein kinase